MAIKYSLHPNKLKGNEGTYYAVVDKTGVVDMDGIINHILKSGSSTSKSDILAVFHELEQAFAYFLKKGYRVNTPLLHVYPSIRGKFSDFTEPFNIGKHEIVPTVEPGKVLNKIIGQATVEKVIPKNQHTIILSYLDVNSSKKDSELTPGGMGIIAGKNLKLDISDPAQGIFFIDSSNSRTKVQHLVKHTKSELIFQVPATLAPGKYKLEIVNVVKNNKKLSTSVNYQLLSVK